MFGVVDPSRSVHQISCVESLAARVLGQVNVARDTGPDGR